MAIDWITALGAQDNSLESLMAKQDLSKKIALMDTLARTKQAADIAKQNREERAREFDIRNKELEETRKEREQRYSESKAQRESSEKRQRYNTLVDNLRPSITQGVTPQTDKAGADLIREYEGAGAVEPVGEPDLATQYLYRKHEAETVAQQLKQQLERQEHQQKLRDQADARAEQANARAEKEAQRREREEQRKVQNADAKVKAANAKVEKLPPHLAAEVKLRAKEIMKAETPFLESLNPWETNSHLADATLKAEQEIREKYEKAGLLKAPAVPDIPAGGRGGGPGAGGPQNEAATKALAAKLGIPYRPGMKIEPVK